MRLLKLFVLLALLALAMGAASEAKRGWVTNLKERLLAFVGSPTLPAPQDIRSEAVEGAALSPTEERALMEGAEAALQVGDIEKALDKLVPVINVMPDHQRANALVGAVLLSINQLEQAEPLLFTAVTQSNFTDCHSVVNLAAVLRKRGESSLALRSLFKALAIAESDHNDDLAVAMISEAIADSYFSVQNFTEAADWYLNSALRKPSDVQSWIKASTLHFPAGAVSHQFAQSVLLKAMEFNPANSKLTLSLGLAVLGVGRVSEAVVLFDEAVRLDESSVDAVIGAATAHHMLAHAEPALRYYARALEVQPENAVLLANYSRLLQSLGRRDEAQRLVARARDLLPNDPDVVRAVQEVSVVNL